MRVLGVDFGEKRVGVAVSDLAGMIARPWGILQRHSNQQVAEKLAGLARELEVEAILVGLPLDASGEEGYQARRVRRFTAILEELLDVPLILWDESLSSVDAQQILYQIGAKKKRRAGPIDDVAAATLLQSYLDQQRARKQDAPPTSG